MKILAVDTSCDESCAAVVDVTRWKLLSDVVHSHVVKMKDWGGVVPEIASREHLKALPLAIDEALKEAGVRLDDIDWFTVTNRPGLIGALLVGVSYVKALAFSQGKPFSVLNHIEGHLFSPLLLTFEEKEAPSFPWVALVVSGGHSELFLVKGIGEYEWLGGTLDDAAGEAFDKVGKLLGLEYPAGPQIDRLVKAKATEADRQAFALPRATPNHFDFSFSGLKTAVLNHRQKLGELTDEKKLQLLASTQEAILDPLIQRAREAQKTYRANRIVVTGGVACNSRFREKLPEAYFPPPRHCTDNAAMMALLSALYYKDQKLGRSPLEATAVAYL